MRPKKKKGKNGGFEIGRVDRPAQDIGRSLQVGFSVEALEFINY